MNDSATEPKNIDAVREKAREWLLRLHCDEATQEDRTAFSRWLEESDAHRAAFEHSERVWRSIGLGDAVLDLVDETELASRVRMSLQQPAGARANETRRRFITRMSRVAAAAVLFAVGGLIWRVAIYDPVEEVRYASAVAQNRPVALPDGSVVTLSGASEIVTRFSRKTRAVTLARGAAYFDVARDADRAFFVTAGRTQVRVLSTAFEIRRGPDDIRVSVAEGQVAVAALQTDGDAAGGAQKRLSAGEQIAASPDGAFLGGKRAFDSGAALAWLEGRFVYDGASLKEVVADVNRYRSKKIEILDPGLFDMKVTTSFRADQTDQMLAASGDRISDQNRAGLEPADYYLQHRGRPVIFTRFFKNIL